MNETPPREWLYENTVPGFVDDVRNGIWRILLTAQRIQDRMQGTHTLVTDNEVQAWAGSLPPFAAVLDQAALDKEQLILIEVRLDVRARIDAVLCGQDVHGADVADVWELKDWSKTLDIACTTSPGYVLAQNRKKPWHTMHHPAMQADRYRKMLRFALRQLPETAIPERVHANVFFSRCTEGIPQQWLKTLNDERYGVYPPQPRYFSPDQSTTMAEYFNLVLSHGRGAIMRDRIQEASQLLTQRDQDAPARES